MVLRFWPLVRTVGVEGELCSQRDPGLSHLCFAMSSSLTFLLSSTTAQRHNGKKNLEEIKQQQGTWTLALGV